MSTATPERDDGTTKESINTQKGKKCIMLECTLPYIALLQKKKKGKRKKVLKKEKRGDKTPPLFLFVE